MGAQFTQLILDAMGQLDYFSIFLLMAAESSILPVPSELVMIPAGYLVFQSKLGLWSVLLVSALGSLTGSLASYGLASWLGRLIVLRFGKYFLISPHHLDQAERFVAKHGEIAIFTGRFLPGIRHLISMPAGLARMRLSPFVLYTTAGATLWNGVLLVVGYLIGENQFWLEKNLFWVVSGAASFALTIIFFYLYHQRRAPAS